MRSGRALMNSMFRGLSQAGLLHPGSRLSKHGVERIENVPYLPTGQEEHLLDVYRPIEREGLLPVVIYIHGGAFQILSKDTHWMMGLAFARKGYVVFNVNYSLSPKVQHPQALQDVMNACLWIKEHAKEYGGDPETLIISGESAGAHLTTGLTLATCYPEIEPWTKPLWEAEIQFQAALPICGILQVSDVERIIRRKPQMSNFVAERLLGVPYAYIPRGAELSEHPLIDPLNFLERGETPTRPLPPFFTAVGTKDPLLDDSRRLKEALDALGVPCEIEYYPGELHAFHALIWRKQARDCWRRQFAFLREVAPSPKLLQEST